MNRRVGHSSALSLRESAKYTTKSAFKCRYSLNYTFATKVRQTEVGDVDCTSSNPFKIYTFNASKVTINPTISSDDKSSPSTVILFSRPLNLVHAISKYLLPNGYPVSVGPDYLSFVVYQMLSMIASTASGVLSTQSLLYALGLGSSAGTLTLAATVNWIVKDGIGQFGTVLFAGLVNTQFDAHPKKWRLLSSACMDISSLLEILAPFYPAYFLPVASIANMGKNISFLSASASRAAIHKSFAKYENLADITAKTASQSILSSVCGTLLGISLSASLSHDFSSIVAVFSLCSVANVYWTYKSLTYVTLNTLSPDRIIFLFHQYWSECRQQLEQNKLIRMAIDGDNCDINAVDVSTLQAVLSLVTLWSPGQVRNNERWLSVPSIAGTRVVVGSRLDQVFSTEYSVKIIKDMFAAEKYVIYIDANNPKVANLLFKTDCSCGDMIQAYVHCYFVMSKLAEQRLQRQASVFNEDICYRLLRQTLAVVIMRPESRVTETIVSGTNSNVESIVNGYIAGRFQQIIFGSLNRDRSHQSNHEQLTEWIVDRMLLEPVVRRIKFD